MDWLDNYHASFYFQKHCVHIRLILKKKIDIDNVTRDTTVLIKTVITHNVNENTSNILYFLVYCYNVTAIAF